MKNHIPCTLIMENEWIIIDFCEELRMDEITCKMSPRVSKVLGPKKVKSSAMSGVRGSASSLLKLITYLAILFATSEVIQGLEKN